MRGSDDGKPSPDTKWLPIGTGLHITRSCGRCGRPTNSAGGRILKPVGFVGRCCLKPEEAKK